MPVTTTDAPAMEREITLVRRLAAPRELVFRTWTEAGHVQRWWGPHGFNARVTALDPRPGGAFEVVMRGPDGGDYPMNAVFDEVTPPERLRFSWTAAGADGVLALKGTTIMTLAEQDGVTELTLTALAVGLAPQAAFMIAGMEQGWSQTLDRLAAAVQA